MTSEALWRDWKPRLWIPALSLPTLAWTRPFLAMMGLPRDVVKQPEIWEPIYTQALKEYNALMEPFWKVGGDEYTLAEMEVTQTVLTKAFQQLASQLGKSTVIDLERWVRRHFLNYEIERAMRCWAFVLGNACLPADSESDQIPPPALLLPLLPEITELIYYGINGSEYVLKHMIPSSRTKEVGQNEDEFVWTSEIALVHQVIKQELTIRALKTIAEKLNEQERAEVLDWALSQAKAITVTSPEYLSGDQYLQVEPPFFDFPSVLDIPVSDEK